MELLSCFSASLSGGSMKVPSFLLFLTLLRHTLAGTPATGFASHARPPREYAASQDHHCHHLARYNSGTNECECETPNGDILDTKLFDLTDEEKSLQRVC
ncbi:hypothetical protein ANCCAN_22413 [Ancylostoma caninum]|uniref:Uncharacterized protein n=1 Tax=Ancylostoma caninum TaxID=29170 RepID=A0A368FI25_ANCCA|nr:hypothetical protein ANCCAN_22413 [Ancylostoma caninum]